MPLTKMGEFTFNHVAQQDDLYKSMSAEQIKAAFDSRGNELKVIVNNLIDALQATTGAGDIGVSAIPGLSGNTVQALLQALKNQMDSTVLGQIPDGAVTKQKLDPAVYAQLIDYTTTTGAANAYVVTLSSPPTSYTDGMAISVKIHADSTGASTVNVNSLGAKSLKKANGTDVTNLKTNGIYTFRYNASTGNFILQGEGASGNAVASDLLSGKTAGSDAGDLVGTMPNRGAMTITPGTTNQVIPEGYHNGSGIVSGDADLIASNIKNGANIFGVAGTLAPSKEVAPLNPTHSDIINAPISSDFYFDGANVYQYSASTSNPYIIEYRLSLTGSVLATRNINMPGAGGQYFVRRCGDYLVVGLLSGTFVILDLNGTIIYQNPTYGSVDIPAIYEPSLGLIIATKNGSAYVYNTAFTALTTNSNANNYSVDTDIHRINKGLYVWLRASGSTIYYAILRIQGGTYTWNYGNLGTGQMNFAMRKIAQLYGPSPY